MLPKNSENSELKLLSAWSSRPIQKMVNMSQGEDCDRKLSRHRTSIFGKYLFGRRFEI